MIYTLTPNPAIDMNISSDGLAPNRITRTRDAVYSPNGKGLNVSFTLQRFGREAPILGFFGGFSGDFIIEGAREQGCAVYPVAVDGITRINVFLNTGTDEYTLPNEGCEVPRQAQEQMLELIDTLPGLSCLVVCGSLPPGVSPTYYDELIDHVQARGGQMILDASHPHLAKLVRRKPLLIKPNDDEAEAIFGVRVTDDQSALDALRTMHEQGCQNVLLTCGAQGAYFSNGRQVWQANAAKVRILSTACAGDAALAAFLSVWYERRDAVEEALVRAMATGANVAMSAGLGDFGLVEELARQIAVHRLR